MSNSLAIATVTSALAAIVTRAAQQAVGGAEVVIGRPQSTPPANAQRWVQLFLYQVTPNAALRNADLPTRNPEGKLTQRPQAALDLHYLLAFYGAENELEPQRMLGAVARDLHAQPILSRQAVRDAIASQPFLAGSDLAEAMELIRFTPEGLSLEELAKLWSVFFQTPYALSISYRGSVVLLESEETAGPALPVLRRGQDDRGVDTLLGPFPALEKIHIGFVEDRELRPRAPSIPNAQLGLLLTVTGRHLGGDGVRLRFTHPRIAPREAIIPAANRTATEIRFTLPQDAPAQTDWAAGLYTLTVIIERAGRVSTTNALSLPLAPRLTHIAPANPVVRDGSGNATLTITCSPQVLTEQRAVLLLDNREVAAAPRLAAIDPLVFTIEQAPVVTAQPVYVRVDGVDSLPFERKSTPPHLEFAANQKVTIT